MCDMCLSDPQSDLDNMEANTKNLDETNSFRFKAKQDFILEPGEFHADDGKGRKVMIIILVQSCSL